MARCLPDAWPDAASSRCVHAQFESLTSNSFHVKSYVSRAHVKRSDLLPHV